MSENKHTIGDLYQMQSLPLKHKITMTKARINAWYEHYDGQVYVSFSGGKDSTVLVDLVHRVCGLTDVPLVFVDTGLEYPEIREFVKSYGDKVTWLKPKMQFKKVIETYGYPFISKEVSNNVDGARKYIKILTDRQTDRLEYLRYPIPTTTEEYVELANMLNKDWGKVKGSPRRLAIMMGMLDKNGKANIPSKDRSQFSCVRYKFLLESPFDISDKCCSVMKKEPVHRYAKESGRKPITAQMASESRLRTQKWLQNGCNGFDMKTPISNPLSFWTEQDILLYIKQNNLPICSVYGDIVEDNIGTEEVQGQLTISDLDGFEDMGIFDAERLPLKTTGCNRTGCMFCGYGCHLEKEGEGRFELMKHTHPKQYEWIMKPWEDGGLGYKEVIDWINENGNLNIRY